MALKKCSKCELNYVRGDEPYCDVCLREMKRVSARGKHAADEPEESEPMICSECGEAPAVHGSDLCAACLKEQKRQVELENAAALDAEYDEAIASDDLEVEEDEE